MIDAETRETLRTLKENARNLLLVGSSIKDVKVVLKKLINVKCPIGEKFEFICITDILSHKKKTDLHRVTESLKILAKLGKILLLKENTRPKRWRQISTSTDDYKKLEIIYGYEEILKIFGYDKTDLVWEFPKTSLIDGSLVACVTLELLLLHFELEALKVNENLLASGDSSVVSKVKTIDEKIQEQLKLFESIKGGKNSSETFSVGADQTEKSLLDELIKSNETNNPVCKMGTVESVENAIDDWEEDELNEDEKRQPDGFMASLVKGIWKRISSTDSTHDNPLTNNNEPEIKPPDSNLCANLDENLNEVSTNNVETSMTPQVAPKCDENLQSESDPKSDKMVLKQTQTRTHRDGQHCDLCGSSTPAVRCEKCSNLIFCLSCDDMYHRHPKRRNHARKAVECLKTPMSKSSDSDADPNRLPVPPPRRRKSQKSVPSSPLFGRKYSQPNPPLPKKEFSFMDKVGSLRRMIGRPLPPVPKDEPPVRPQKSFPQNESSPFRRVSSSCSSYSNVSDNEAPPNEVGYQNFKSRQSPTYANEPVSQMHQHPAEWENQGRINTSHQTSYPNSLSKADLASGVQLGFQGFPTLPKRGYNNPTGTMTGDRVSTTNSVSDMQSRAAGMQPMNMPQAHSIQDLNHMQQMQPAPPFINPYMSPYPMMPPWMAHPQNYYYPNVFQPPDHLKRTPSNSSMNYPCSESGFRLNSYTSMGHLHNPMAMAPYSPYIPQTQKPPSPTFSSKSARPHKTHNDGGEGPFPRSGRRSTHHGVFHHAGRRSILDHTSSEEDYFSASDEEELRSIRTGRSHEKGWQCEHCTLINSSSTRICVACCKTAPAAGKSSGERRRRRRDGGVKSPTSGGVDSRPSSGLKERRPSSKTPEDEVDDLINEMDAALNVNQTAEKSMTSNKIPNVSSGVQADGVEVEKRTETENGIKSQGNEPQRKIEVISKGTSPPPQTISTQTNLTDDTHSEEPRSGPIYRASSRSSLIGGDREFSHSYRRPNPVYPNSNSDQLPYFSSSRSSLYGGISKDPSPVRTYFDEPEFGSNRDRQYPVDSVSRNDYYLNLEELIERRRQEKMRSQGFELVRLLREAEQNNFAADDLQIAMNHCGNQNAVQWLQENWKNMVDTVVTLVSNYGRDKKENDVGVISTTEAKESLRRHKGNVWAAVTDSVETRQQKFRDLQSRSNFNREEIIASLTANHGNVEAAYLELTKNAMKPFHMQIWGPPVGVENESGTSVVSAVQRNNFDSLLIKPAAMTGRSMDNNVDDNARKMWVEELTGGAKGVGGIDDIKKSANEGKLEFQPNRNTPHKVNRTGSFSGGSCISSLNDQSSSSFENAKMLPVEDTYVSVEWVAENKKPPETNYVPSPKLKEKSPPIYSRLEEFGLGLAVKPTPPETNYVPPSKLREKSPPIYSRLEEFGLGMTVKPTPPETNYVPPSKLREKTPPTYSRLEEFGLGLAVKPTPKFSIDLDQFQDIDDDDEHVKSVETASVYTSLEEIAAAAEDFERNSRDNEETIDAAAETILDTARTLMYDNHPTITMPVVTAPAPQPPPLQVISAPVIEELPQLIAPPPPPPPLRTEASKKASSEFERRARMCLAEGKVSTYSQAEMCVKLIDLQFPEADAISAANECSEIDMAITFLQQECELCAGKYPMRMMIPMLNCIHRCCENCAKEYYSIQIRDRNIMDAICPFCDQPDLTDDDIATDYFTNLDIVLKNLVDYDVHELFQRKLRDRALMKDPNFRWCSQCSFGFIAPPPITKLNCPDCKAVTCADCRKPWEVQHTGISCEQFTAWKEANDPEFQAKGLEKHLEENGINCPSCKFRYALAKGGCMHFQCTQCKYDFCSGCGKPFKMGPKCNFSPMCMKLGLHAHHPRNCLFYLRDKDPADLQKLLRANNIVFNTEPPPLSAAAQTDRAIFKCQVMEQKDIRGFGLKDEICGKDVEEGYAGLCSGHYVEYLVNLICQNGVDPIAIFDQNELQQELRRRAIAVPEKLQIQTDDAYREVLSQIINEQIPLDEASNR